MIQIIKSLYIAALLLKGGAGSGNFGHDGRPGEIGGSGGGGSDMRAIANDMADGIAGMNQADVKAGIARRSAERVANDMKSKIDSADIPMDIKDGLKSDLSVIVDRIDATNELVSQGRHKEARTMLSNMMRDTANVASGLESAKRIISRGN